MGTIRRYGASMVAPEVMPRPQLGRGNEATFQAFEGAFNKVNEFIRPAVVRHQTVKGENEAVADLETSGARFELEQVPADANSTAIQPRGNRVSPGQNIAQTGGLAGTNGTFDLSSIAVGGATRPDSFTGMGAGFRSSLEAMISSAPDGIREGIKVGSALSTAPILKS